MDIKETKEFKAVLKTLKSVTLDPKKYTKHIMKMHSQRKMSKLSGSSKLSAKKVASAIAVDQAYRSTILAYKLECQQLDTWITQLVDASVLKIMNLHYDEIPPKTKGEKRQYVYDLFIENIPVWNELETTVETADAIIEDIDKAAWSAKHIIQTFELATRPELNY